MILKVYESFVEDVLHCKPMYVRLKMNRSLIYKPVYSCRKFIRHDLVCFENPMARNCITLGYIETQNLPFYDIREVPPVALMGRTDPIRVRHKKILCRFRLLTGEERQKFVEQYGDT